MATYFPGINFQLSSDEDFQDRGRDRERSRSPLVRPPSLLDRARLLDQQSRRINVSLYTSPNDLNISQKFVSDPEMKVLSHIFIKVEQLVN